MKLCSDVCTSLPASKQRATPHPAAPGLGSGGRRPPPGLHPGAGSSPASWGRMRPVEHDFSLPVAAICSINVLVIEFMKRTMPRVRSSPSSVPRQAPQPLDRGAPRRARRKGRQGTAHRRPLEPRRLGRGDRGAGRGDGEKDAGRRQGDPRRPHARGRRRLRSAPARPPQRGATRRHERHVGDEYPGGRMRGQDRARDGPLRRLRPRRAGRAPGSRGDGDRGAGAAHASEDSPAGAGKGRSLARRRQGDARGVVGGRRLPASGPRVRETVQEKGAPAALGRLRSELVPAAGCDRDAAAPQNDRLQMAPETSEKIENAPGENLSPEETAPELPRHGEEGEASPESVGEPPIGGSLPPILFTAGAPDEAAAARLQMAPQNPEIIESAPENDMHPGSPVPAGGRATAAPRAA